MRRFVLAFAALFTVGAPSLLMAQRDSVLTVASYLDLETVSDPQLSPDGKQIIYTRRFVNTREDRWETALWIMDADGGRQRFLTRGSGPRWSPDGTRIPISPPGNRRARSSSCDGWTPRGRRVR